MTALSIVLSKHGKLAAFSPGFGPSSNLVVTNWVVWTGNGSPPMPLWGKPVWGDLTGRNPTDRGKAGTKHSLLVEAQGRPLERDSSRSQHPYDTKLLAATIEAIVVARPESTVESPQNLRLDKAYDNPTGHEVVPAYGYQGHIRPKGG
jgi:hypothetical protein